jgi:hypothetical protein
MDSTSGQPPKDRRRDAGKVFPYHTTAQQGGDAQRRNSAGPPQKWQMIPHRLHIAKRGSRDCPPRIDMLRGKAGWLAPPRVMLGERPEATFKMTAELAVILSTRTARTSTAKRHGTALKAFHRAAKAKPDLP